MSLLLCYSFMPQDNSPAFTGFAGKKTCCFVHLTEIHKKEGVYRGNSSQQVDSIHLFRLTWANSILSSSDFITVEEKHLSFFLMAYEWKRQSTVFLNKKEKMRRLSWIECRNTTYRLPHTFYTTRGKSRAVLSLLSVHAESRTALLQAAEMYNCELLSQRIHSPKGQGKQRKMSVLVFISPQGCKGMTLAVV